MVPTNKKCLFHITIGAFSCHLRRVNPRQRPLTCQWDPVPQQALNWGYIPVREVKPPCIRAHFGGPDSPVDPDDFPRLVQPDGGRVIVDDSEGSGEFFAGSSGVRP